MYKAERAQDGKWVISKVKGDTTEARQGDMFFYNLELAMAATICLLGIETGLLDKQGEDDKWKAMTAKYLVLDL